MNDNIATEGMHHAAVKCMVQQSNVQIESSWQTSPISLITHIFHTLSLLFIIYKKKRKRKKEVTIRKG
jgi:hypothetical protein